MAEERTLRDELAAKGYNVEISAPTSERFSLLSGMHRGIQSYETANDAGLQSLKAAKRELARQGLDEELYVNDIDPEKIEGLAGDVIDFYTGKGFKLKEPPNDRSTDRSSWEIRLLSANQRLLVLLSEEMRLKSGNVNYYVSASKNPLGRIVGDE